MHILFVSTEFHPHAKSGGLADAVTSLAKALTGRNHRVSVVIPRYRTMPFEDFQDLRFPLGIPLGYREEWVGVHRSEYHGVELYALEHNELFSHREGIYGPAAATAYGDNLRRFALLSRGALQLALAMKWTPEIIHAHDWPSGLVPAFHRLRYDGTPISRAGTVFSIHNFGYQGRYAPEEAAHPGLSRQELTWSGVLRFDQVNLVRGALRNAHRIVAVSPRYAEEIQTAAFGHDLHEEVRARRSDLTGIINGIDDDEWDPATDPVIPSRYTRDDRSGKTVCKETVQQEFGLPRDRNTPLLGMVTRLTEQKGIDALFHRLHGSVQRICSDLPVQFVLLGSGEAWCEEEVLSLSERHPNFSAIIGYNHALAHRVIAGCDFLLMPSLYEPCGLNQMYAMRYGTIPVVSRTGGLADTVDEETGFLIPNNTSEAIFLAVHNAVRTYRRERPRLESMRDLGMRRDFSWSRSARKYEELYLNLIRTRQDLPVPRPA